jgi:predicted site-specific integrase-resolvase
LYLILIFKKIIEYGINGEFKIPEKEITEYFIEIITVYISKIHGKRCNKIVKI